MIRQPMRPSSFQSFYKRRASIFSSHLSTWWLVLKNLLFSHLLLFCFVFFNYNQSNNKIYFLTLFSPHTPSGMESNQNIMDFHHYIVEWSSYLPFFNASILHPPCWIAVYVFFHFKDWKNGLAWWGLFHWGRALLRKRLLNDGPDLAKKIIIILCLYYIKMKTFIWGPSWMLSLNNKILSSNV